MRKALNDSIRQLGAQSKYLSEQVGRQPAACNCMLERPGQCLIEWFKLHEQHVGVMCLDS